MAIPIALQSLLRVVLFLQTQEVHELGITGFHLLARCEAMIGEEVASLEADGGVNHPAKIGGSLRLARLGMHHVEIADDAYGRLPRPRQKTLSIALDEADGAIGHVRLV